MWSSSNYLEAAYHILLMQVLQLENSNQDLQLLLEKANRTLETIHIEVYSDFFLQFQTRLTPLSLGMKISGFCHGGS